MERSVQAARAGARWGWRQAATFVKHRLWRPVKYFGTPLWFIVEVVDQIKKLVEGVEFLDDRGVLGWLKRVILDWGLVDFAGNVLQDYPEGVIVGAVLTGLVWWRLDNWSDIRKAKYDAARRVHKVPDKRLKRRRNKGR